MWGLLFSILGSSEIQIIKSLWEGIIYNILFDVVRRFIWNIFAGISRFFQACHTTVSRSGSNWEFWLQFILVRNKPFRSNYSNWRSQRNRAFFSVFLVLLVPSMQPHSELGCTTVNQIETLCRGLNLVLKSALCFLPENKNLPYFEAHVRHLYISQACIWQ